MGIHLHHHARTETDRQTDRDGAQTYTKKRKTSSVKMEPKGYSSQAWAFVKLHLELLENMTQNHLMFGNQVSVGYF